MDVPAVVDGVAIPVNTMIATRCNKLGRGTGLGVGEDGDAAYTLTAAHPYAVCAAVKFHQGAGAGRRGVRARAVAHAHRRLAQPRRPDRG